MSQNIVLFKDILVPSPSVPTLSVAILSRVYLSVPYRAARQTYSGWGETESTWHVGLLYQPRMIDGADCGAVGGMRIGRVNRSTWSKPAPVPLCPPQNQHDLTWARTRAAAVGSRRLTAWSTGRPVTLRYIYCKYLCSSPPCVATIKFAPSMRTHKKLENR
jgi:hypothetical protein